VCVCVHVCVCVCVCSCSTGLCAASLDAIKWFCRQGQGTYIYAFQYITIHYLYQYLFKVVQYITYINTFQSISKEFQSIAIKWFCRQGQGTYIYTCQYITMYRLYQHILTYLLTSLHVTSKWLYRQGQGTYIYAFQ